MQDETNNQSIDTSEAGRVQDIKTEHPNVPNCHLLGLPGGRRIAFSEFGDPAGTPMIILHGSPGGRVQGLLCDKPARQAGVRIIAIDRPGYGYTDPEPNYTFLTFAEDVGVLLSDLNVEKATVVGISGGGTYALAVALCFPEKIAEVVLLAGMTSLGPKSIQGLSFMAKIINFGACHIPGLTGWCYKPMLTADINGRFFKKMMQNQPKLDRELMQDPVALSVLGGAAREDFLRQGVRMLMNDLARIYSPVPFDVSEIQMPVRLVYGEKDISVPASVGKVLARSLPNASLNIIPDAGHLAVCGLPEFLFGNAGDVS